MARTRAVSVATLQLNERQILSGLKAPWNVCLSAGDDALRPLEYARFRTRTIWLRTDRSGSECCPLNAFQPSPVIKARNVGEAKSDQRCDVLI